MGVGTCTGAPFLPTLAGLARGDRATAAGVMVLLMVLTVGVAPVVAAGEMGRRSSRSTGRAPTTTPI
jgi:hypothetical protein